MERSGSAGAGEEHLASRERAFWIGNGLEGWWADGGFFILPVNRTDRERGAGLILWDNKWCFWSADSAVNRFGKLIPTYRTKKCKSLQVV